MNFALSSTRQLWITLWITLSLFCVALTPLGVAKAATAVDLSADITTIATDQVQYMPTWTGGSVIFGIDSSDQFCDSAGQRVGTSLYSVNANTVIQVLTSPASFGWRVTPNWFQNNAPPSGHGCVRFTTTGSAFSPDYSGTFYYFNVQGTSGDMSITSTPSDTSTHIISVTPAASSTIATSTAVTFGADVYVNQADYSSGMTVEIKYARQAEGALGLAACTDCLFTRLVLPIAGPGASTLSTTSPALSLGRYTMVTTMRNPSVIDNVLQFLGFGQFATLGVKTATTTTFVVGQKNSIDTMTDSLEQAINDYVASSTVSLASCAGWTSFNLIDCVNVMFVPQWAPIKTALDNFRQGFLTYWPWGYLTRVAVIMSGSATTTLPAFSVTMTNVLPPGVADSAYTLDQNDMLAGAASRLNAISRRGGTENLQDIAEPILRTFLALLILMIIVRDLSKIGGGAYHSSSANKGHV